MIFFTLLLAVDFIPVAECFPNSAENKKKGKEIKKLENEYKLK